MACQIVNFGTGSMKYKPPSTIAFKLEYELFYELYAKLSQFAIKNCSVQFFSATYTSKLSPENEVTADGKTSKRHPDVMHESRLTPPPV